MIRNSEIIEISLITSLFVLCMLKIYDIYTDNLIMINMCLLNLFWFVRSKLFHEKIRLLKIVENQLISILLWAVILNLCEVRFSTLFFVFSFFILFIFYFIKFLIIRKEQKDWLIRHETWIIAIVFLSFFLKYMNYLGSGILMTLSFATYAILLIFYGIISSNGFIRPEYKNFKFTFLLEYFSLSILILSILFHSMFWYGSRNLFWIGLFSTVIVSTGFFPKTLDLLKLNDHYSEMVKFTFKKVIILTFTSIILFSFSSKQFYRLDFGNRPKLIESYVECRFKNNFDENCDACKEFFKLEKEMRDGQYPEGSK